MCITPLLSVAPETGEEQDEHRQALESAQQHQRAAQPFGHRREGCIAAEAATGAKAGTVAGDASEDGAERFGGSDATKHQQQNAD